MNTPAKIFVIVNLVLSAAFATLSVSLYAKKVNFVKEADAAIAKYNDVNAKLKKAEGTAKDAVDDLRIATEDFKSKLNTANNTIKSLQNESAAKTRDIEDLKASVSAASVAMNGIRADINGMLAQKAALEKRIEGLTGELDKSNSAMLLAQRQAIEISATLKNTNSELVDIRKHNADLQERLLAANTLVQQYEKRIGPLQSIAPPVEVVRGEVYRVEEENGMVIIRLGSDDNVSAGMELMISRGDEFIGKVNIINVKDDICSAEIDTALTKKPIRVGDVAQTI